MKLVRHQTKKPISIQSLDTLTPGMVLCDPLIGTNYYYLVVTLNKVNHLVALHDNKVYAPKICDNEWLKTLIPVEAELHIL